MNWMLNAYSPLQNPSGISSSHRLDQANERSHSAAKSPAIRPDLRKEEEEGDTGVVVKTAASETETFLRLESFEVKTRPRLSISKTNNNNNEYLF